MQNINGQTIVTFLLVAVAGGYLARRLYLFLNRKAGCSSGGCNGCDTQKTTSQPDNFVSIDALTSNNDTEKS